MLATQSWLVSRGLVRWHRRVALGALVLLPVMILSALRMVAVMFANPQMPPFLPPLLALIDLPSVAFLIVLVTLALRNARVFAPQVDFMMALHGSLVTVELILVALIVSDRRAGERRLAYPLSLAFFIVALRGIVWVNSRDIPEVQRSLSEGNRGLRGEGRRPEVPA